MVIEDEQMGSEDMNFDDMGEQVQNAAAPNITRSRFVEKLHKLREPAKHRQLQQDLIEHQWGRLGQS